MISKHRKNFEKFPEFSLFIAHYGYKVTLNSNWVQSFNKSIVTDIYGHSVAEYPELPLGKANYLIPLNIFKTFNHI